jgi:hypothetical protein
MYWMSVHFQRYFTSDGPCGCDQPMFWKDLNAMNQIRQHHKFPLKDSTV